MPLHTLPRRGAALFGAALLLASTGPRGPASATEADGAPSPPAERPPAPASLSPDGRPPAAEPSPFEALAEGRWRIRFPTGREELSPSAAGRVEELGRRLAESAKNGRVTVEAQSSGPEADVSAARRLSLERALAVKAALAHGGLSPTRIDLRPLGRTPEAVDAADILPPPPPAASRRGGGDAGGR